MNKTTHIRELVPSDLAHIKTVIDDNQLFPSAYLDDMTKDYFSGNADLWFVAEKEDKPIAVIFCSPEPMTEGTWNILLIAVLKDEQGNGIGGALMDKIECTLKQNKGRLVIVETSGLPEFELTRQFYPKCGYKQVASIPDFYGHSEDKIVFWKPINPLFKN